MVQLAALPGVEIEIVSAGVPLQEHLSSEEQGDYLSQHRWICVESDQEFEVKVKVRQGTMHLGDCLSIKAYFDGHFASHAVLFAGGSWMRDNVHHISGVPVGQDQLRRFAFSALGTVDDDHNLDGAVNIASQIGTIVVVVWHAVHLGYCVKPEDRELPDVKVIPEKALKGMGITHNVRYSSPIPAKHGAWVAVRPLGYPPLNATFHYRTLEMLKSMLIVPRTPSPQPLHEMSYDEMSEEQRRQAFLQYQTNMAQKRTHIKAENEDTEEGHQRPQKRAHLSIGRSRPSQDAGHDGDDVTIVKRESRSPEVLALDDN